MTVAAAVRAASGCDTLGVVRDLPVTVVSAVVRGCGGRGSGGRGRCRGAVCGRMLAALMSVSPFFKRTARVGAGASLPPGP